MSADNNIVKTFVAGTGGVTKGCAVKISSGTVVAFTAADDVLVGVALAGAAAGEEVAICIAGEVDVLAGGTVTELSDVITNATGRFTVQAASGSQVIDGYGKALEDGTSGRYTRVLLYDVPVAAVGA